jgi:predicted ABC-type ATPase
MIAGPNGSGKSTLILDLMRAGAHFGLYFNADDIARTLLGSDRASAAQQIVRERRSAALAGGDNHIAGRR